MDSKLSLNQAANLIALTGQTNTYMLRGEMGIGKSSILGMLAARPEFANHIPVYVDCTLADLQDLFLPFMGEHNGVKVTQFAPSTRFGLQHGAPLMIMLDELTKASPAVMNALLPLMQEGRLGEHKLPAGSLVFGTGNLAGEGVGDRMPKHGYNRMTEIVVRKPTPSEWTQWAIANDVAPEVIAFVTQIGATLEDYDPKTSKSNPYINKPDSKDTAFVTPRSLHKAGHIVKQRASIGDHEAFSAALAGTIGRQAAADMASLITVADRLTPMEQVLANPLKAKLPEDAIAGLVFAVTAATRIGSLKAPQLEALGQYITRMPEEHGALFATPAIRAHVNAVTGTKSMATLFKDSARLSAGV